MERDGYIDFYTRVIGDGPRLTIKQRKTEQITEKQASLIEMEANSSLSDDIIAERPINCKST